MTRAGAPPGKVTGVTVTPGDGALVVGWAAVSDATGYRVQWKSGNQNYNNTGRQAVIDSGLTVSHPIAGLTNGTEYTVRVTATRTGANDGPHSDEVTGTPFAADTTAPAFSSAGVDGATLVITFDEPLAAASDLDNAAFAVKKTPSGGSEETVTLSGSPSMSGATVTLTLATAVVSTDTVTVSYTVPSTGSNNRLEDAAGNEVASFANQAVDNVTDAVSVGIAANYTTIGAGVHDLVFTLTRTGATTAELAATVTIDQHETWLANANLSHTVTFEAGDAEAELTLDAQDFSFDPDTTGDLTATVSGAGIAGGSTVVEVVSTAHPPITVSFDELSYTFAEDAPDDDVAVWLEVTLDPDYPLRPPSRTVWVDVSTDGNTASSGDDYIFIFKQVAIESADYELASGSYRARWRLQHQDGTFFDVVDDEVYEGDEDLVVTLDRGVGSAVGLLRIVDRNGSTCTPGIDTDCNSDPSSRLKYPITITDEEDRPELSLSVSPASIAEEDDDSTTNLSENASTVTVAITNAKTFAADQTVTLTFGGSATNGTDYAVTPADADASTNGHQVALPAGASSVALTVTATANAAADGNRTITITGALDAMAIGTEQQITILDDDSTDTTAPAFVSATVDGTALQIVFDEVLAAASALANAAFTVKKTPSGSSEETVTLSGSPSMSGATVTLTLATAVVSTDTVTVSYTVPSTGSNNRLEDAAGNEVASFDDKAVTNNTAAEGELGAPWVSPVRGDAEALKVRWSAPENTDPELFYDVRYRVAGSTDDDWADGPQGVTGTSVTLTGLTEGTEYEVQVRAGGDEAGNDWSGSGTGTPQLVTGTHGALRLVDDHGVTTSGTGRLEVFYRGEWGTVCDDRFDGSQYGSDYPDDLEDKTENPNHAPVLACQLMGFATGEVHWPSALGMTSTAPDGQRIWLDDVACADAEDEADWRLNRGKDPGDADWQTERVGLHQCFHAGIGLENCDHDEDVHLQCTGTYTAPETAAQAGADELTAQFANPPAAHDGESEFTVEIVFSETPHGTDGQLPGMRNRTLKDILEVTGGAVTVVGRVDGDGAHRFVKIAPDGTVRSPSPFSRARTATRWIRSAPSPVDCSRRRFSCGCRARAPRVRRRR